MEATAPKRAVSKKEEDKRVSQRDVEAEDCKSLSVRTRKTTCMLPFSQFYGEDVDASTILVRGVCEAGAFVSCPTSALPCLASLIPATFA